MFKIKKGNNRFYVVNSYNQEIGELTYSTRDSNYFIVNHTYVDPNYRGQNIAKTLVDRFVKYSRDENKKIIPLCSYVKAVFSRNKNEYHDVWENNE